MLILCHIFPAFGAATILQASKLLERCIGVELQAKQVYAAFAKTFVGTKSAHQFFEVLAQQEEDHAHLLQLCLPAAKQVVWEAEAIGMWQDLISCLEQKMKMMAPSLEGMDSLEDALWLVIQIESSEVNDMFLGLVSAIEWNYVRDLRPFREAMDLHITHICQHIPELAPDLMEACQQLRAKFDQR